MDLAFELDLGPLRAALSALPSTLDDELEEAVREGARVVAALAKAQHPYTDRTGRLTRSIFAYRPTGRFTRDTLSARIAARTHYASYVEEGTPRARAFPYLEPALRTSQVAVEALAEGAVERALRLAGL